MYKWKTYTEEEYLQAVRQDGRALQYVKEQTEEICLEAVKDNIDALQYVEDYYESVDKIVNNEEYSALKPRFKVPHATMADAVATMINYYNLDKVNEQKFVKLLDHFIEGIS